MGRFLVLVDAPAVIAFADRDVLTAGSVESPRRIGRIVFVGQFFGTPRNRISVFCRDTVLDKVKTNGSVIVCGCFISTVR